MFDEQEAVLEAGDWELADACYARIRGTLTMTLPDSGTAVEFWLRIHGEGSASWRWHDEPCPALAGT